MRVLVKTQENSTSAKKNLQMLDPRCVIYSIEEGFFVQVKTRLSYDVSIIILMTCFGLDNGPSSGHKTYI